MRTIKHFIRSAFAISAVGLLILASGCSKSANSNSASAAPAAQAQSQTASQAATPSKLGDLSEFRKISSDVLAIVDKGDLPAAKTRIKDLEIAWDSAEAGLKPRAADDWHRLDKAIDQALRALRADKPVQSTCKAAMTDLQATIDGLSGKAM